MDSAYGVGVEGPSSTATNSGGDSKGVGCGSTAAPPNRYESQKLRDWNTFLKYLKNQKPPLTLTQCSGASVIQFLKYLDQFGKTKVHVEGCPYFGQPNPQELCACPLKQAWGSLDALIGRLRAAYEENGGSPESNPFAAKAVRTYLTEVRERQANARGISYKKNKRKRSTATADTPVAGGVSYTSSVGGNVDVDGNGNGNGNGNGTNLISTTTTTCYKIN